ncbi:DUF2812 domain-containing protein [Bacillus suaedae]|uniref:DUF2812 domain-containing protein n=1 Tax=Halalkalibacter suaedae TaxID=2822140 RepID=A0A940WZK8_9BACI|nr:DUF2812 domain-containing protein [Bacillus suaedae]MBP3951765.1 DUF2812 domain-containing protein [Bacillus suaedae]
MRRTKYVMSGGLAFSEDKDMKKLRRFSLKGWHVSDLSFLGYTLEKGGSTDYIYSVDYRSLAEGEEDEYFDFFSSSGWTHITSEGYIHLFRAIPGTKPIYSDSATVVEKHDNLGSSMKWLAISLVFLTILVWIGALNSTVTIQKTLHVIAVILTVITIPMTMTLLAIYSNKWGAEGKKGLAKLIKVSFFIIAILFILFVAGDLSEGIATVKSMIIGGIVLPTAIWILMSLYHKWIGRRA